MLPLLTIMDSTRSFMLEEKEALDLELKLNVTTFGHTWSKVGDVLFNFATGRSTVDSFTVTVEQYDFLKLLMTKSKNDCSTL